MALLCTECYTIKLPECAETITIDGGLDPEKEFWVEITNRFGQHFDVRKTTDVDGKIELDVSEYQEGLFVKSAGTFTLKVKKTFGAECVPETLTLCEAEYNCVNISFYPVLMPTDEELAATIPCDCEEEVV